MKKYYVPSMDDDFVDWAVGLGGSILPESWPAAADDEETAAFLVLLPPKNVQFNKLFINCY